MGDQVPCVKKLNSEKVREVCLRKSGVVLRVMALRPELGSLGNGSVDHMTSKQTSPLPSHTHLKQCITFVMPEAKSKQTQSAAFVSLLTVLAGLKAVLKKTAMIPSV